MESLNFIIGLIIVLVLFIVWDMMHKESFSVDLYQTYEPTNYNTRVQNCNELTFDPNNCSVETVIPTNTNVCDGGLTPIDNNNKGCGKKKNKKTPSVSLKYDFDLLPSFNNAQINNLNQKNHHSDDLKTEIRSLNSLENDLMSMN